jgi:hypothetical protein
MITVTPPPPAVLTAVTISPIEVTLKSGTSQYFIATPACESGVNSVLCPASGVSYVWSINNPDGAITNTSGATTTFTAGNSNGVVVLKVVASMNGTTAQYAANIQVNYTATSPNNPYFSGNWSYVILAIILAAIAVLIIAVVSRRREIPSTRVDGETAEPAGMAFGAGEVAPAVLPEPEPPVGGSEDDISPVEPESPPPEEAPVVPTYVRPDSSEPDENPVDVANIVAWPTTPKTEPAPPAPEHNEAAVAEIQKELENARVRSPPPPPPKAEVKAVEVPKTKKKSAREIPASEKCFICGTVLQGEYCPTCDMHWDSKDPPKRH